MNTKNINFNDKKIKKVTFAKVRQIISIDNIEYTFQIDNIDVNKILVSKKEPYGTKNALKYFFGYNDNDVIRPFCLRLPQMTGHFKKFNKNATMYFIVNNKQLFKKLQ